MDSQDSLVSLTFPDLCTNEIAQYIQEPPRETLMSLHHIQKFPFTIIPIIQYKFNGVVIEKRVHYAAQLEILM